jgi:hypothetical protein
MTGLRVRNWTLETFFERILFSVYIKLTWILASSAFDNPFSDEFLSHSFWHERISSSYEISPLFAIVVATDTPDAVVVPWRQQNDCRATIEQTLYTTLKTRILGFEKMYCYGVNVSPG